MRTPLPLRPDDPTEAGPFRLLGRLAAGGMGVVYLARRDDRPESLVAMKLMRTDHGHAAHEHVLRERFRAEVDASSRVAARPSTTTHVARLVEADADAPTPWLATEFVPGPSVADAVDERALDAHEVLEVARALADALVALHAEGLVHGDVKPANVVLGPDGVRLVDLGLARDADEDLALAMGSPGWAPPEAHVPGASGMPADVFGWGMTVAYAAAGRHPYGDGPSDALTARMREHVPDLSPLPRLLRPLVSAAPAPDPAARPTAGALSRALHGSPSAAAGAGAAATQPLGQPTEALVSPTLVEDDDVVPWSSAPEPPSRRRARDAALAATLVAVAALVVGVLAAVGLAGRSGPVAEVETPATSSAPASASPSRTPSTPKPTAAAAPVAAQPAPAGGQSGGKGPGKDPGKGKGKGGGKKNA